VILSVLGYIGLALFLIVLGSVFFIRSRYRHGAPIPGDTVEIQVVGLAAKGIGRRIRLTSKSGEEFVQLQTIATSEPGNRIEVSVPEQLWSKETLDALSEVAQGTGIPMHSEEVNDMIVRRLDLTGDLTQITEQLNSLLFGVLGFNEQENLYVFGDVGRKNSKRISNYMA